MQRTCIQKVFNKCYLIFIDLPPIISMKTRTHLPCTMLCSYHLDDKGLRWMCKIGSGIYLFQDLKMQFQPPPWKCWAGTRSYWCRSSLIQPWRKSHHAPPPKKTRRFIPSQMNHRDECCQLTQRQATLEIGFPILLSRDSKGVHSLWTISSGVLFLCISSPCQLRTKTWQAVIFHAQKVQCWDRSHNTTRTPPISCLPINLLKSSDKKKTCPRRA